MCTRRATCYAPPPSAAAAALPTNEPRLCTVPQITLTKIVYVDISCSPVSSCNQTYQHLNVFVYFLVVCVDRFLSTIGNTSNPAPCSFTHTNKATALASGD